MDAVGSSYPAQLSQFQKICANGKGRQFQHFTWTELPWEASLQFKIDDFEDLPLTEVVLIKVDLNPFNYIIFECIFQSRYVKFFPNMVSHLCANFIEADIELKFEFLGLLNESFPKKFQIQFESSRNQMQSKLPQTISHYESLSSGSDTEVVNEECEINTQN